MSVWRCYTPSGLRCSFDLDYVLKLMCEVCTPIGEIHLLKHQSSVSIGHWLQWKCMLEGKSKQWPMAVHVFNTGDQRLLSPSVNLPQPTEPKSTSQLTVRPGRCDWKSMRRKLKTDIRKHPFHPRMQIFAIIRQNVGLRQKCCNRAKYYCLLWWIS